MVQDSYGLHHFHRRKRIHLKHEPYPHPDKFKRFFDKFIFFVGVFGPALTIPQSVKVWVNKDTSGISLVTWFSYIFISLSWLTYGILHKEKPIILANIGWLLVHSSIITGVLIYG